MSPEQGGFETLLVTADGARGEITLNRPERLNALSALVLEELAGAAAWLDAQDTVKVVLVSGAGRSFSAGADLAGFSAGADDAAVRASAARGREMGDAVAGMQAITIAAIQGHCLGGALVLAAACDLRIATRSALFGLPEVDLGIPLTWGGIPRLASELGPAVTKELVLTCRTAGAEELHALRFLNTVVAEDELDARAVALAEKLASQPANALRVTKRHVQSVIDEGARRTRELIDDDQLLLDALRDPESLETMRAYLSRHA